MATPKRGVEVTREGSKISKRMDDLILRAVEGSSSRKIEDLHMKRAVMPWEAFHVNDRTRCCVPI